MRKLFVAGAAIIVSTSSALAHTRPHERHHRVTVIERLEIEIAALRREVRGITQPSGAWDRPVAIPFADDALSVGSLVVKASLEIPERAVIKPIEELADSIGLATDRAYLIGTACPGYTMHRQGVALSIERLHPQFAHRLAAAFRDARQHDMRPCIFSAYRPPAYGVGGFRNKFNSAHSYGLAVDLDGIRRHYAQWLKIAASHDLYRPYAKRSEWNHFQPTPVRMVTLAVRGLRNTITGQGPISLAKMWKVAEAIIPGPGKHIALPRYAIEPRGIRHRHYARQRIGLLRVSDVSRSASPTNLLRNY